MKKIFLLSILFLGFSAFLFSKSSVWKVSKDGHAIYIGGSIHILTATDYPLPSAFDKAFNESDKLVFETDMDELLTPTVFAKIMQESVLPDGKTLEDVLDEDVYKELHKRLEEFSIPFESVKHFKPGPLSTFLTLVKHNRLGYTEEGVDIYYFNKAKKEGKQTGFLEPVECQITFSTNIGVGHENEYMAYTLKELDDVQAQTEALIDDWKNGSSENVQMAIEEMQIEFPDVYKELFKDRNDNWIPQIEQYIRKKEHVFIIAGLAHMYGKNGIFDLLEQKGYLIEQLD
ncbi:MAG: TraB/GumN family protein [Candidatus Azobacteroides sp.]|nr:TraB/GumN family protein [Candidatus Azobacteroides sp.]